MTLLLGHRGHRLKNRPGRENTLAAFDYALSAGCDGFELDLHATADGRAVIHHDPLLADCHVPLADASLRALRRLNPTLATLDQVLRRFGHRAWMDLEIKAAAAVAPVLAALERQPPRRGFVLSSFEPGVLVRLAASNSSLPLCLNLRRPVRRWRLHGLHATWIAPHQAACTAWYVRRLRQEGWRVLVWTVNRPAKMRLLARAGADALVSDDPRLLVQTLASMQTR